MKIKKFSLDGHTYSHHPQVLYWKLMGSLYTPKIVLTLGQMAINGDLKAAKLIFSFLGHNTRTGRS